MKDLSEIKSGVIKLLVEVTENQELDSQLSDSTNLVEDIGLDSIQLINFILTLEDEFGIDVDFEAFDFDNLKSLKSLCEYIGNLLKESEKSSAI